MNKSEYKPFQETTKRVLKSENSAEQLIQAETTLDLIDKLVKKIHKEYPTALITETWEIQNLIKDYKEV